uniref:MADF domain-containing protein n=1 Tax=Ditylenchus dipsaci TaxID=166011 RepID=A0A915DEI4_9BILA
MPLGQWTTENKIRLIQEFKKHSKLWNTENDDFIRSPVMRSHEIAKITEFINKHEAKNHFTHDQIRFQIGFLKGEYLRRKKLLKKSQKQSKDVAKEPNWVFYQHLKFLDDAEASTKPAPKVSPLLDENFCKISDANTVLPSGSALRRLRQTKVASYKLKNAKRATIKPVSSDSQLTTPTPNPH